MQIELSGETLRSCDVIPDEEMQSERTVQKVGEVGTLLNYMSLSQ